MAEVFYDALTLATLDPRTPVRVGPFGEVNHAACQAHILIISEDISARMLREGAWVVATQRRPSCWYCSRAFTEDPPVWPTRK